MSSQTQNTTTVEQGSMSNADFEEQLTQGSVIATNTLAAILFAAFLPATVGELAVIGIPAGRVEAVTFGVFLALALLPVVFVALAYHGYTER